MLKTGASHHQIAKDLHVNISVVVKVSHALKKGQSPATPYVPKQNKTKSGAVKKIKSDAAAMVTGTHSAQYAVDAKKQLDAGQDSSTATAFGEDSKQGNSGEQKQEQRLSVQLDSAIEARLVPVAIDIPITQIMQNWRAYLVIKKHLPADTKWEDIIETTFYRYAKLLDPPVTLQAWYEGETHDSSPEPAPEKVSMKSVDNSHKLMDINSKEFEKLVTGMMVKTINAIQAGELEI